VLVREKPVFVGSGAPDPYPLTKNSNNSQIECTFPSNYDIFFFQPDLPEKNIRVCREIFHQSQVENTNRGAIKKFGSVETHMNGGSHPKHENRILRGAAFFF
jgi:hypothetical protein